MNSIKTRVQRMIEERLIKEPGAVITNEKRRNTYDPLLRRMWSLDSLNQKDKVHSFAWFSLFDLFENTPPNKNDLTNLMDIAKIDFDKSKKIGELKHDFFVKTMPEHEKMTEAEMKTVIERLCAIQGKK